MNSPAAPSRPRRSKARTTLFVVMYLVLLAAFLEVSARVVLAASVSRFAARALPEGYEGELQRVANWSNIWGGGYVRDPILRYYHRDGLFRQGERWTDFHRTDEELVIMCLGSSTTYGINVPGHQAYPSLLEGKLRAEFPGRRIRVLNAGLPGANPKHSKRLYQFRLYEYEPDILIWRQTPVLSDHWNVDVTRSRVRFAAWWVVAHSKLLALLSLALDSGDANDIAVLAFDRFYGEDVELDPAAAGSNLPSNFHMVQYMVQQHGGHAIALEYLSVSDPRVANPRIWSDAAQYAGIGVTEVIRIEKQFRELIAKHGTSAVFSDIEHMSVLGTEVMAQAAFEYLVADPVFRSKLGVGPPPDAEPPVLGGSEEAGELDSSRGEPGPTAAP